MSIRTKLLLTFFITMSALLTLQSLILRAETRARFGNLVCGRISKLSPELSHNIDYHFNAALWTSLLWILCVFIVIVVGISLFLSRALTKRMLLLQKKAEDIANGNWTASRPREAQLDELGQLDHTLDYLAEQLHKQDVFRKSLMQDIAHELRTPLTTLKSHMEAFVDGVWEPSESRLRSCIEEVDRFQSLVDQVEQLYDADSNTGADATKLDLRPIVRSATDLFRSRCESANIHLNLVNCPEPVLIYANPHHISRIIWNLLDNAVKYTPHGGKIDIEVGHGDGHAYFTVSDTGIGIPVDELDNIFERFYRVDKSRTRSSGGSGLGLSIAKQLTSLWGGNIRVNSVVHRGTSFLVEWPAH